MLKLRNQYFILRHGQTIYQTKKKDFIYPWPNHHSVSLTKKGENQIKAVAKKLKRKKIRAIYSSDIYRTRQTAEILKKELGLKINFDKRLRDINLGIYHGKTKEEFYQDFPKNSMKRFSQRPKKGESWRDAQKRMLDFLKEIDKKYKNENILIISHGDPLWLLKGALMGISEKKILENRKKLFPKVGELEKL